MQKMKQTANKEPSKYASINYFHMLDRFTCQGNCGNQPINKKLLRDRNTINLRIKVGTPKPRIKIR